jgi:nitrate/nitrite transporter NarK
MTTGAGRHTVARVEDRVGTSGATRNLVLGTVGFAVAFTPWGLLAPLARKFQDDFGLTDTETAV